MDPEVVVYPSGFGLSLDRTTRRPSPRTLIGGQPLRVLKLSDTGARLLDSWLSGATIGSQPAAQRLARRLVAAGIAQPRPGEKSGPRFDDVTVVIPVRDRPQGLAATLAGLRDLKVVVVDDASEHAISIENVQVIRRAGHGGPGPARNAGWRSVQSPIVVFLDADCVPEPGWLAQLLPHFADPRVGAVAPRVRSVAGRERVARYEAVMSPLDMGRAAAAVGPGKRVAYVPTACLAVRRSALDTTGGFDEGLRFGEDVDLVWRLIDSGWVVRYEPAAVVTHPPRPDAVSMMRQRFDYGRSAAPLADRHGSDLSPFEVSPWTCAVWALVTAGRPVPAAALVAILSAALAHRAAPDAAAGRELATLAARGNLVAGRGLATAVRRAWVPLLLLALPYAPPATRRRLAVWLAASYLFPLGEWLELAMKDERPALGPLSWTAFRWLDDLAYQAGVWTGVLERRSARALLPRWSRPEPAPRPAVQAEVDSSSARPVSR